jgi:hypothetical protein
MAVLRRPARPFSFFQHQRERAQNQTVPGDQLDATIADLIEVVSSTQDALSEIRRDDGRLHTGTVGREHLSGALYDELMAIMEKRAAMLLSGVAELITQAKIDANHISLRADDAEHAAIAGRQNLSAILSADDRVASKTSQVLQAADIVDTHATDSENWANYSHAQADNAAQSEDNALAWAEYLAGPVVSGPDAPAFIAQSPYPHGLFYQPIDGAGGLGGLWSAKWWAIYSQQLVGFISFYYLGGWDHPPAPGEQNPATGRAVPNPLAPGSIYYDTDDLVLRVWTGETWIEPFSLTGGVISRFAYKATAGQTVFSGADLFGATPAFTSGEQHDVHVNGVKLTRDDGTGKGDYTVNDATDALTLLFPATANSIVQWDLLVNPNKLAPGAATIYKLQTLTPDGVTKTFTMQYSGPGGITNVNATKAAEIMVVLDGVQQEPVTEYSASGSTLTMVTAPPATSRLWAVYFKPGGP